MKEHERRWWRTDDGEWITAPGRGPAGRILVTPDGRIHRSGFPDPMTVDQARWWSLRLAEAAALAETLTPLEIDASPAGRVQVAFPPEKQTPRACPACGSPNSIHARGCNWRDEVDGR